MIQQLINELNGLLIEERNLLKLDGKSFLIIKKEVDITNSFAKAIKSQIWRLYLGTGERGYSLFSIRVNSLDEEVLLH